ncbi:MAG: hypothetical protein LBU32_29925 [Clostridiales bacterium]|nr:hypothetical protein [Clostridiales bacterium]
MDIMETARKAEKDSARQAEEDAAEFTCHDIIHLFCKRCKFRDAKKLPEEKGLSPARRCWA